jgi:hypothetical protein
MKQLVALTMMAALVIPFPVQAQAKPDFSGTWTLDPQRSTLPQGRGGRGGGGRGGGRGMAGPIVIKQTASEIVIGDAAYKLDGSESVNQVQGRGGMQQVTSKARWDGAKLVIESTREIQGFSIGTKEVRSLDAGGKEMVVEMTTSTPQGDLASKLIYTKS